MNELAGQRVLIFLGKDYEDMELQYPKYRLIEAGAEVVLAAEKLEHTYLGKHGYPQQANAELVNIEPADYDALVVPGGWMPDLLRRYDTVKRITQAIHQADKCLASICHGAWINISADVVRGYEYTSTPGIKDDLMNAGATWVDEPLVIDRHHVSSRKPDDLPEFCKGILQVMMQGQGS